MISGGFPDELYRIQYPAPGHPALATEIADLLRKCGIESALETNRGLDHGAWVPLSLTWPAARIPVLQVSLPMPSAPPRIVAIGQALRPLRERGALLLGSGGIVHNLRRIRLGGDPPPDEWAVQFDDWVQARLNDRDWASLLDYRRLAPHVAVMASGDEHLLTCMAIGSEGSMVSIAVLVPDLIVALDRAIAASDLATARALNDRIYPLATAMCG